jgi:endonuclease YncB( thermonuclease family)
MKRITQNTLRVCPSLLLLAMVGCDSLADGPKHTWKCVGVTDGDTITCLTPEKQQVKIRLNAIDAPERGQPFANKSKQALSDMVFGKDVTVEVLDIDKYNRTVGRITIGGLDVNHEMVTRGMAWQYVKYDQSRDLREAEQSARAARVGLWADPHATPPWEWRKFDKEERARKRAVSLPVK